MINSIIKFIESLRTPSPRGPNVSAIRASLRRFDDYGTEERFDVMQEAQDKNKDLKEKS